MNEKAETYSPDVGFVYPSIMIELNKHMYENE